MGLGIVYVNVFTKIEVQVCVCEGKLRKNVHSFVLLPRKAAFSIRENRFE